MSAALSAARTELNGNLTTMHAELRDAGSLNGRRLLVRITVLLVVLAAVVFAAFHYLPLVFRQ